MSKSLIYNGDSLEAINTIYAHGFILPFVFADPPDNLGLQYDGFKDKIPPRQYNDFMLDLISCATRNTIFWLSYYHAYDPLVMHDVFRRSGTHDCKKIIWRFTFGQHRETEFGSGYRPIVRMTKPDVDLSHYISEIRIESERQRLGDSRANPKGRVPDDVWDFPRVTGNALERRTWHPTQHPEALLNRIVLSSGGRDLKLITDCFAGTGSLLRVAKDLNIPGLGFEQSKLYCENMSLSLPDCKVTTSLAEVVDYVGNALL